MLAVGDFADARYELLVFVEIVAGEARVAVWSPIVFPKIAEFSDGTGEEAATERAIGNETDAEFAQRGDNFFLGVALPQRIFRLQRGDRMHFVSAADRIGCGF